MLQRVRIGPHERGLVRRDGEYRRLLRPGVHWLWGWRTWVERLSTRDPEVAVTDLDVVLRDPEVWADVLVADLRDDERAVLALDGRVRWVLGPGRTAFWKGFYEVTLDARRVAPTAAGLRVEHPQLDALLAAPGARERLLEVVVPRGARGLLYVDERLEAELEPGRYAFWKGVAAVRVEAVDLREAVLEVQGQEILTADKVSVRVNLSAAWRVEKPRLAAEAQAGAGAALYRELQLALREAVGGRTLDALLAAKEALGAEVARAVEPVARGLGLAVRGVGLKDVILPGEMKTLLNQVIEAEKRAQANLVARREETAATRSLLNTAKLIEQSPTLLRLKELEAAERIAGAVGSLSVTGNGLDGLLERLLPRATS